MSPQVPDTAAPGARPPAAAPPRIRPAAPAKFARLLQQRMAESERGVARARAAIDAIRDGAAVFRGGVVQDGAPPLAPYRSNLQALLPYRSPLAASAAGPDPFGWRSFSRRVGDELVAPGYGAIFERQIEQESGFAPEVAFGLRRSSAGAEGIAQLMPEYYPGVDRADPRASLVVAARTMSHYLAVFDGDVRKALASYNAGLGRVQSLVAAHGDDWERALPEETKRYLAAIVGDASATIPPRPPADAAVFGGSGPGGLLTLPLDRVLGERPVDGLLELLAVAGVVVRAPADGRVVAVRGPGDAATVVLDHGNGWRSSLGGLTELLVAVGGQVRRSDPLGALSGGMAAGQGWLRFGVTLDERLLFPGRYLLPV